MIKFGEKVSGYDVLVFNEREVRAAAGIVFLFAFMAFMNGFLTGNNEPTKLMVSAFLFDFFIRIALNPKWGAGSLTTKSQNTPTPSPKDGPGVLALFWQPYCFI